jgi:microcompartment protein CcmL/EutN
MAGDHLAGQFLIPNIHPSVLESIDKRIPAPDDGNSLGLIETTNVAACIVAADSAVKAADVILLELRLANRLGGKSYVLIWGQVGAVEAAVSAGVAIVPDDGLVQQAVIPSLHPDLRAVITRALAAEA